jgi:hypothetical protein
MINLSFLPKQFLFPGCSEHVHNAKRKKKNYTESKANSEQAKASDELEGYVDNLNFEW